jgi:hypothetical protein
LSDISHSRCAGHPWMGIQPLHSLNYADANDADIAVNVQFLKCVEILFRPNTILSVEDSANIFLDWNVEEQNIRRRDERGLPAKV